MEITYTMIGADGLQYGPITSDQLRAWVTEGRVTGETKILRSDTNTWLPAAQYAELGMPQVAVAAAPLSPPPATAMPMQDPVLERRMRTAAGWFFFIAIFSVINTVMAMSHQGAFFLVGLGVHRRTSNLEVNILASGIFALFGVFAKKGHSWSFIVGMIFYGLDALIFLQDSFWLPLAFHIYGLVRIFMGLMACNQLKAQGR